MQEQQSTWEQSLNQGVKWMCTPVAFNRSLNAFMTCSLIAFLDYTTVGGAILAASQTNAAHFRSLKVIRMLECMRGSQSTLPFAFAVKLMLATDCTPLRSPEGCTRRGSVQTSVDLYKLECGYNTAQKSSGSVRFLIEKHQVACTGRAGSEKQKEMNHSASAIFWQNPFELWAKHRATGKVASPVLPQKIFRYGHWLSVRWSQV